MIPIETERLRLRAFESRDAVRLARYRSEPTVAVYQSWSEMTLSEAEQLIATPYDPTRLDRWSQIAVADRETDELIGDIGICVRSPGDVAELGVTFAPDGQGKGLAAEACRAAIELLFSLSSVTRIEAIVDARNYAAIALMRRLGMRLDRTEEAVFKGEVCSEHHFVLPRFEYFERAIRVLA